MFSADQFVAHRGYATHYPENTLAAFDAAIKAGARHIELDIQFSKDGIPMLYHDTGLQRTSSRDGCIFDYTAEELEKINAGEPERLGETFSNVLIQRAEALLPLIKNHPGVHFYLELKEETLVQFPVDDCLKTLYRIFAPVKAQCTLISFDLAAMKRAKEITGFSLTGIVFRDWENRNVLIREYLADIAYINIERIPKGERITADCPIVTYEITDTAVAADTLRRGAAKIETFDIGELIKTLCRTNTM